MKDWTKDPVAWDDHAETMDAIHSVTQSPADAADAMAEQAHIHLTSTDDDTEHSLWVRAAIACRHAGHAWAIAEAWSCPAITEAEYHAVLADTETRPVAYISHQASVTVWRTPTGEIVARCVRVGNVVRFTR